MFEYIVKLKTYTNILLLELFINPYVPGKGR